MPNWKCSYCGEWWGRDDSSCKNLDCPERQRVTYQVEAFLGSFEYGTCCGEVMLFLPEDCTLDHKDFENAFDIQIILTTKRKNNE